ncbi:MAG TPA: type III pantothenate kinase [Thermoanaerobaculia bacterium]|nr:type III pantothenate kinase [Thermoanaerobaculia bacterium]
MNLLVVDVGNTNIVLGIFRGEELAASWRIATARERTDDEYGIVVRQLIEAGAMPHLDAAIVASVVPPLDGVIRRMLTRYFDLDPVFVQPGIKTGLAIKTENPLEVGADRIANAVAALELYGAPTIVVDFGTATTFDLVGEGGEYRGGLIAPGLTISAEALFARAARLPRVEIRRPEQVIGTSTVASMQAGLFWGYLGTIDGILGRMIDEIGAVRTVVATGEIIPGLVEESRLIERIDPDLTLRGLRIIEERNRKRPRSRT